MPTVSKLASERTARCGIGGNFFSGMSRERQQQRREQLLIAGMPPALIERLCRRPAVTYLHQKPR